MGLPSGASFWPLSDDNPDAPRAPLGQAAAAERQEEETSNGFGQADAELPVGNGEGEEEGNAGSPSPPQLHHSGPEWQQQNASGAFPFYFSAPRLALQHPVPNVFPHVAPAVLYDFPYVYPYAYSAPALHLAYPYVAPHFPYAAPYFAFADPYTFHIATSSFPLAHQNPYLYSDPQEDAFYGETDNEEGSGIPEFNSLSFAGLVENIGPLWDGDMYEEFSFSGLSPSFSEDTETPSTSGLGSSARRHKDSSNEEEAVIKKPRWSNDGDSD